MIETNLYDKSSWPRGEWDNEPDKIEFTDEETGYFCEAARVNYSGVWCGYVSIPFSHPALHYKCPCCKDYHFIEGLKVHWGVNYKRPNEDKTLFCLGFDCGHCTDISPKDDDQSFKDDRAYRNKEYVLNEIRSLAKQLKELENYTPSN
jgi:hypothetical protein